VKFIIFFIFRILYVIYIRIWTFLFLFRKKEKLIQEKKNPKTQ
jgi:hypothetical protein